MKHHLCSTRSPALRLNPLPCLLLLAVMLASAGCVMFTSRYDAQTDAAVQELAKKTEVFVAEVTITKGSYNKHADFYRMVEGEIRAIEMRAALYSDNEAELELLQNLRAQFGLLRRTHDETGAISSSGAEGIRSTLRQLLQLQLMKKRSTKIIEPSA